MDNTDCLEKLVEDVVRKQKDSLDSVEALCQRVERVSSDISNLINRLQMVGNRQFSENRVREDNMMGHDIKNGSSTPTGDQESPNSREQLTLRSILLRAIQLVPDDAPECTELCISRHDDSESDTFQGVEANEVVEEFNNVVTTSKQSDEGHTEKQERVNIMDQLSSIMKIRTDQISKTIEVQPDRSQLDKSTSSSGDIDETKINIFQPQVVPPKETEKQQQPSRISIAEVDKPSRLLPEKPTEGRTKPATPKKPIDRERVADILKRYSLYDDDDDDDDDESD